MYLSSWDDQWFKKTKFVNFDLQEKAMVLTS